MFKVLTNEEMNVDMYGGNDVLFFFLEGCGPCSASFPVIEKVSEEYPHVNFYKVVHTHESEEFTEFKDFYDVTSYPTLVVKRLGQVKFFFVGLPTEEQAFRDILDAAYAE